MWHAQLIPVRREGNSVVYFAGMFRVANVEFIPEYRQAGSHEFVSMATRIQHVVSGGVVLCIIHFVHSDCVKCCCCSCRWAACTKCPQWLACTSTPSFQTSGTLPKHQYPTHSARCDKFILSCHILCVCNPSVPTTREAFWCIFGWCLKSLAWRARPCARNAWPSSSGTRFTPAWRTARRWATSWISL